MSKATYPGQQPRSTRARILIGVVALLVAAGLVLTGVALGGTFSSSTGTHHSAKTSGPVATRDDCGDTADVPASVHDHTGYDSFVHHIGACMLSRIVATGGQPVANQLTVLRKFTQLSAAELQDAPRVLPAGSTGYTTTVLGFDNAFRNGQLNLFYREHWTELGKPVEGLCVDHADTELVNPTASNPATWAITELYRECGLDPSDVGVGGLEPVK
jgi:hypothetical protein